MQNQGSLGPTTVAELLQTMQQERATGTLSLASNGSQCSLHFLFGHLFHAVGGEAEGEPAVVDALSWRDGEYSFNPRAKLPPEETINSSTEDLVALWRAGRESHPAISAAEVTVTVAAATTPAAGGDTADELDTDDEDWLDTVATGEIAAEVGAPADIPTFQTPAPPVPALERAFAAPQLAPVAAAPGPTPRPAAASPTWPSSRSATSEKARLATASRPAATSRPPTPPASSGEPASPGARPVAGATKSQLSLVIPMPAGSSLHSGLKASFLNFPMLLQTLAQDGFSGYVSITGETDSRNVGHILFREGAVIQAQHRSAGSYRRHKAALQEVVRGVRSGEGLIDAIELPASLVESVGGLVVANTLYLQLPSRIVDFDALIEFVDEQPFTGGILVTSGQDQVSVVLLTEGQAKGSYSSLNPELTEGPGVAAAAHSEREARIDVIAAPPGPLPAIELAEIA
ncbi:MAG TPA: DUF4388 domain-containing protein [Candidatus Acidoferrales bacterium]|nr:DUF4388 domain-containing protein [Candidatus Acidoferrales bacterium]